MHIIKFGKSFILLIVTVLIIVFGFFIFRYYDVFNSFHESNVINKHAPISSNEVSTFLLLGLDNSSKRQLSTSRTDGMMVVVINKRTKVITLCNLLRDSFTKIYSKQYTGNQRIEAAYTYGGNAASVATVEHFLNLPIDYFITFNWDGFTQVIDDVGPLKVNINKGFVGQNFQGKPIHFKKGINYLDGRSALSFARERHVDNDQYRGFRQQKILEALIHNAHGTKILKNSAKIADDLTGKLQTNLTSNDILSEIQQLSKLKKYKINRLTFQWRTFDTAGRSMVEVYPDSQKHVSEQLRFAAGLTPTEPSKIFQTNGKYRYKSDESVQSISDEKLEDTAYGLPHHYIGTPNNIKTGQLPEQVPLKNGFRASDRTNTTYH